MWTRDDAIALPIIYIERELAERGWHVALAGGVLIHGSSDHDLDIIVYPHCSIDACIKKLREGLVAAGLHIVRTAEELHAFWREKGSVDRKHVEVWATSTGRRVDVFVWPTMPAVSARETDKPDRRALVARTSADRVLADAAAVMLEPAKPERRAKKRRTSDKRKR